jgi:uncharacterized repeat protein (TIGR03803 family)
LAVDSAGNIYGATTTGGTGPSTFAGPGCGVVYKLDPLGNETVLHTFIESDGASPSATPVLDSAGNLYDTTFTRGQCGFGEVYKIDAAGNFSVLYSFAGGTDGSQPMAGVVLDTAGNLYGTTTAGGSTTHSPFGSGVIYRIDTLGNYRVLYRFDGVSASFPQAPLLISRWALYGTAAAGSNNGAVFKLVP